jgi:hypothetical protein
MTTHNPSYEPHNLELSRAYGLPLTTVDDAITGALEHAAKVDGWSGIPDMNPLIWNRVGSDVLHTLDDHVLMGEAAA